MSTSASRTSSVEEFRERLRATLDRVWDGRQSPEYQSGAERSSAEWERIETEQRERSYEATLRARGVPESEWAALREPRESQAIRAVRAFVDGPSRILVVGGASGKGKTFAVAYAVAHYGGLFVQAGDLVAARFDRVSWDAWEAARLLAIDDLGAESKDDKGWLEADFFRLMDGRLQGGRKTLITTNLSGRDFMARYASGPLERMRRRFREQGSFVATTQTWDQPDAGGEA
jgi:DNA replication protein DnaC